VHAIGAGGGAFAPLNLPVGVYGQGGADNAAGVLGHPGSPVGDGVHGFLPSGNGVLGESGNGVGVRATSTSSTAVVAVGSTGLFASTTVRNGTAAQFDGNVVINGIHSQRRGEVGGRGIPGRITPSPLLYGKSRELVRGFRLRQIVERRGPRSPRPPRFSTIVEDEGYHVFISEYEDHNELYVSHRTRTEFLVRAKAQMATGTFSYRIVAKRRDIHAARFEEVDVMEKRS
jgi:hypothetical protein